MRAIGLFLLLAGSVLLLLPWYGQLLHYFQLTRSEAQLYGGLALFGGIAVLVVARIQAR